MEPGGLMQHSQGPSNYPYPQSNQPVPISLRSILILSSHLGLGLPKGLFPVDVPVEVLKSTPTFFHSGYKTCPSQFARLNHPDYIRSTVQTVNLLIMEPSPFPILLGPNICLRILFSNTLSLDSSLNVRYHVSKPYSTTGNIIVLYILIFKFLERSLDDKSVWTE